MKKFLKEKIQKVRKQEEEDRPSRITNETVAEHREQILAGGRRFKYPIQVAKHRLVIVSVLIGIVTLILLVLVGYQQLYMAQNTSKFMYRLTQLIPVPVASVDGEAVRYSDFLKKYRSSIHALQQQNSINLRTADGKRQADYIKRTQLDTVEKDTYAVKLAREEKIVVTNEEIDAFINKDLASKSVSLEAYEKTVLSSFYDWTLADYREVVRTELLKRKVSFKIDSAAEKEIRDVERRVQGGEDFAAVAKQVSDDVTTKDTGGDVGELPLDNQDSNGLIAAAKGMSVGQVSAPIQGTDGYYIIKLVARTDTAVHYSQIKVDLTEFDKKFDAVKKAGKIKEHIKVERT